MVRSQLRLAEGFVVNEWLIEAACWHSRRATQSAVAYWALKFFTVLTTAPFQTKGCFVFSDTLLQIEWYSGFRWAYFFFLLKGEEKDAGNKTNLCWDDAIGNSTSDPTKFKELKTWCQRAFFILILLSEGVLLKGAAACNAWDSLHLRIGCGTLIWKNGLIEAKQKATFLFGEALKIYCGIGKKKSCYCDNW